MILDRQNRILYASVSERTNKELVNQFSREFGYSSVLFNSHQKINNTFSPIYHTNVMMSVCSEFCVICLDSIDDLNQKKNVILSLEKSGKKIIDISQEQKNNLQATCYSYKENTKLWSCHLQHLMYYQLIKKSF